MARNLLKEAEWAQRTYKQYSFKMRLDTDLSLWLEKESKRRDKKGSELIREILDEYRQLSGGGNDKKSE